MMQPASVSGRTRTFIPPEPDALTTDEFAKLLHCSGTIVRQCVRYGFFQPLNPPGRIMRCAGAYFFSRKEVERVLNMTDQELYDMRTIVIQKTRDAQAARDAAKRAHDQSQAEQAS